MQQLLPHGPDCPAAAAAAAAARLPARAGTERLSVPPRSSPLPGNGHMHPPPHWLVCRHESKRQGGRAAAGLGLVRWLVHRPVPAEVLATAAHRACAVFHCPP